MVKCVDAGLETGLPDPGERHIATLRNPGEKDVVQHQKEAPKNRVQEDTMWGELRIQDTEDKNLNIHVCGGLQRRVPI
jgi:hypothetical protein